MFRRQPQGAESAHAQARDEQRRGLANSWHRGASRRRNFFHNPPFKILLWMRKVTGTITPQTIAGHGQDHRRNLARFDQAGGRAMGSSFEGPGPMAAINPVQQDHQRKRLSQRGFLRREQGKISSLPKSLALYRH